MNEFKRGVVASLKNIEFAGRIAARCLQMAKKGDARSWAAATAGLGVLVRMIEETSRITREMENDDGFQKGIRSYEKERKQSQKMRS